MACSRRYTRQELFPAMQPFEWSEDYSVGIPELDIQPRQLMELIGELTRCANADDSARLAPVALERVADYAERHLQREELVLRVRGYPGYADHKAEHDAFRLKVATLRTQSERRDFGVRIASFLNEWWRSHVLISDQQYARYFSRHPSGL
jgi:hemerythrin